MKSKISKTTVLFMLFLTSSSFLIQSVKADSDNMAPTIFNVWREPEQPTEKSNVVVFVDLKDKDGLSNVRLLYETSSGFSQVVSMNYVFSWFSQGSIFKGFIEKLTEGTSVKYWIEATDSSDEHLTRTSLFYYYYVCKDGAPNVGIHTNLPNFLSEGSTEDLQIDFSVEDEDLVELEDIKLKYRINGDVEQSLSTQLIGDGNYSTILPNPLFLGLEIGDELRFWIEAEDYYNQIGRTREYFLTCIGDSPFVNNLFISPSVPSSIDNITVNAEIFYRETLTITEVKAYYSIDTISGNCPLSESTNEYNFISEIINSLGKRGILSIYLDISYNIDDSFQSDVYSFSIIDNKQPELVNDYAVFLNPLDQIKETEQAKVEAHVYDNSRTYHAIAWFRDNFGTHGVELLRDNEEYLSWIGDFGDDGTSFLEEISLDQDLTTELQLDGIVCKPDFISHVYWDNADLSSSTCDLNFQTGINKTYLGLNLRRYLDSSFYNQISLTLKGFSDNILFNGIKESISSENYLWEPISEGTSHNGNLHLSSTDYEEILIYNIDSSIENTKYLWFEFVVYDEGTIFNSLDRVSLDKVRVQHVETIGDSGEDRDYAVYTGSYTPVGPDTELDFYLSLHDYSLTTYTPISSRKLSVVDGIAPIISFADVMGIDYLDPFIPISCILDDSSEIENITLFYRINSEEYNNISMNEVALKEYYVELNNSEEQFTFNDTVDYYIVSWDIYGNKAISETKTIRISEVVLPTVILSSSDTVADYESYITLSANINDIHSGIERLEFHWTNPRNISGRYIFQNLSGLLVEPSEFTELFEITVTNLGLSGYLYWYVIVVDGEGNLCKSNLMNVRVIDLHPPTYKEHSILNSLDFIGSDEDGFIEVTVTDASAIKSISLKAIETASDSTLFEVPAIIDWSGYSHDGVDYTYKFKLFNPNSANWWNPGSILSFVLEVVDVYDQYTSIFSISPTTIWDKNNPLIMNLDYVYEETNLDYYSLIIDFADETAINGTIYYGIEHELKEDFSNWGKIEFDLDETIGVFNAVNNKLDYHFENNISFTYNLEWLDAIDYYIYIVDEYGNERFYYNTEILDHNSLANDYSSDTYEVAFLNNFRLKNVLKLNNFKEFPYDDQCLIYDNTPDGHDLIYAPYKYGDETYVPDTERHSSAIYSYDFDVSNGKEMSVNGIDYSLGEFIYTPDPYTWKYIWSDPVCIATVVASDGYLTIENNDDVFNTWGHIGEPLPIQVFIPLSFSKMFPFFEISFSQISNCEVNVFAMNYWSWNNTWRYGTPYTSYIEDPNEFNTLLMENISSTGEHHASLVRPEEFAGVLLEIYPDIIEDIDVDHVRYGSYRVVLDFLKVYQIQYDYGGEDIDTLANDELWGLGYDNLAYYYYEDFEGQNMASWFNPYYHSELRDCILYPLTTDYETSWVGEESYRYFSLAGVYYTEYVDGQTVLVYDEPYEDLGIPYYPTQFCFYDIPMFDIYDYSLGYMAQDIKINYEGILNMTYAEYAYSDPFSRNEIYKISMPNYQSRLSPLDGNARSEILLELGKGAWIYDITWSCLEAKLNDDFMKWASGGGFMDSAIQSVFFLADCDDVSRNLMYYMFDDEFLNLYTSEGYSVWLSSFLHPDLLGYMSSTWDIPTTIQNIDELIGYGESSDIMSFPDRMKYYFSYKIDGDFRITSTSHQSIGSYEPIIEIGNNIQFSSSIYESSSYAQVHLEDYVFESPDCYDDCFFKIKLTAPSASRNISVAFTLNSIGEHWINKTQAYVQESYERVNWGRQRMYLLNYSSRDAEGYQLFSFTYFDSDAMPSSYFDSLILNSTLESFIGDSLPNYAFIQAIYAYDYRNNQKIIVEYSRYNESEYIITSTEKSFVIPINFTGNIFALRNIEIIIGIQSDVNNINWLRFGKIYFDNNETLPKTQLIEDIFVPELQSLSFMNLDYANTEFLLQGLLTDSMSGISKVKIYYRRFYADFVNDVHDISLDENNLFRYFDPDYILLSSYSLDLQNYNILESIPNVDYPYYVTRLCLMIEVWDDALNPNKQTFYEIFETEDCSSPEFDYQTIYFGSYGYSNQVFDFSIVGIDLISGVSDVEIWFTVHEHDFTNFTYFEQMSLFSGNEKDGTWVYSHTASSSNQWETDQYVEYYYKLSDALGYEIITQTYSINLFDDVEPYVLVSDIDFTIPNVPDANHNLDIVLRATDTCSNPVFIQLEYSVFDHDLATIVYSSSLKSMSYDPSWDYINSEGEFSGFRYTIEYLESGGFDYDDQIIITFHVTDEVGNVITLDNYYWIWVGDNLSPTEATITYPNDLANDQNYLSRVFVTDNLGGSGIETVILYTSYDNNTWTTHTLNFELINGEIYLFSEYILQSNLHAGQDILYYVEVYDFESNRYVSSIGSHHIMDKLPPNITNVQINPSEIGYEDTPNLSSEIMTYEPPSSVLFEYTINGINPQTLSLTYDNSTGEYSCTIPNYGYLSVIQGEIKAYSSGGTLNTYTVSYSILDTTKPEITISSSTHFIEGQNGEIVVSVYDLCPNLFLGDEWVTAKYRLNGTTGAFQPCSYSLMGGYYSFIIPGSYLEDQVIEVKITAIDNYLNIQEVFLYYTILENNVPSVQSLNKPSSVGYSLDFNFEISLFDETGIDPSSVRYKHKKPDGTWTNLIVMTDLGTNNFEASVFSSDHYGIYVIDCYVEFQDIIGNWAYTTFTVESQDIYSPAVPLLHNPPSYIEIDGNPDETVTIFVSSLDDSPSGGYYCSSGNYRYKIGAEDWTSWNILLPHDGTKMKLTLSDISSSYLGETITYEIQMFDDYTNPSSIISGTLIVDDYTGPSISFSAPSTYGDNSNLVLSATITSSGYSLSTSSVSFDYYKTDPTSRVYLSVVPDGSTFIVTIPNAQINYGDTLHYRFVAADTRPVLANSEYDSDETIINIDETAPIVTSLINDDSNNIIHHFEDLGVTVFLDDISGYASTEIRCKGHYESTWLNWIPLTKNLIEDSIWDGEFSQYYFSWLPGGSSYLWHDIQIKTRDTCGNEEIYSYDNFVQVVDLRTPTPETPTISDSYIYNDESFYVYIDSVDQDEEYGSSMMDYVKLYYKVQNSDDTWPSSYTYAGVMTKIDSNTWRMSSGPFTAYGGRYVKFLCKAVDNAGKYAYASSVTVLIHQHDTTLPSVTSWFGDPSQPDANSYFIVKAYISEPDSPLSNVDVEYYVNSGAKTHYTLDMSWHASGQYWYRLNVPTGGAYVKTYFRIHATSGGGSVTTSYHSVTANSGIFSVQSQELFEWSFDIERCYFEAKLLLQTGDNVLLHIYDTYSDEKYIHPLYSTDPFTFGSLLNLNHGQELDFYLTITDSYSICYTSDTYSLFLGDIYSPDILDVNILDYGELKKYVTIKSRVFDRNLEGVYLELLEPLADDNWRVVKNHKMVMEDDSFAYELKLKNIDGYYLRIRAEDKFNHITLSNINYLYSIQTSNTLNSDFIVVLFTALGIVGGGLAVIFRTKIHFLGKEFVSNFIKKTSRGKQK